MARTNVPASAGVGSFPVLPLTADSADLAWTAADLANKNAASFGSAARMVVLAWNTDASARTSTITSALDTLNRSGDISAYSIGANEIAFFVFERNGWRQSDNNLYFEANNALVKFAVILL